MAGRLTKVNKTSYLLTIPVHPYPDKACTYKLHPGYLGAPRASRNQATCILERAIVSQQHVMLMKAKLQDTGFNVERNVER